MKANSKNTSKKSSKKSSKKAQAKTAPKKEKRPMLSKKMDELTAKGGTFAELIAAGNKFCEENGLKTRLNQAFWQAFISFRTRTQGKKTYLEDLGVKVTEAGIEKIKKAA